MANFSFIQKLRNRIKIKGQNHTILFEDRDSLNLTGSKISISGKNNTLHIKKNVRIKNADIEIKGDNCSIIIGNDVMIGYNSYLSVKESTSIELGDDVGLSRNVKIMTSDGHPIYQDGIRINEAKNIKIENKVWIADNVTILKGVEIGSNSVIGINSTVTKSSPSGSILAGNPAKIVKSGISWEA